MSVKIIGGALTSKIIGVDKCSGSVAQLHSYEVAVFDNLLA